MSWVHAPECLQAPEQFEGRPVDEKVDVYAFGMLMWECITRSQPWADLHNPMQVRAHIYTNS